MKESRFVKVALIVLMLLLLTDIGMRFLDNPKEVAAAGKVQYKAVSLGSISTAPQYEQLLNSMADQG